MNWTLTVGGADLSAYLLAGASFWETASSSEGTATFTVNGAHASLLQNAAITLTDSSGAVAWEGTVASTSAQLDSDGNTIATLVQAKSLAAAFAIGISSGSYQNNDIAVLAAQIASLTSIPWGGPSVFGSAVGALTFAQANEALTTLAALGARTWGVRNGRLQFASSGDGIAAIPVALQTVSNAVSKIRILGGADAVTRVPLSMEITPVGEPSGPSVYVSQAEIADATTLGILAGVLAGRYGAGAVRAQASFTGVTIRAGDWVKDPNGVIAIAYRTRYEIVNGILRVTASFGFPQLPQNPQYSAAFSDAMHRTPIARLHSDYVVRGCDLSVNGLSASISDGSVNIGGQVYHLNAQTLNLTAGETVLLIATAAGFAIAPTLAAPAPGTGVALFTVTANASAILQQGDIRTHGGVGNGNLKPANPNNTPSVSVGSITLAAEGAASAKATIPFTINGLTLDDTIGSIEVVQSLAGENQWGNSHTVVWSPGTTSFTDYRHGLSAGQGYDLAVNILGRNGIPLNASPLIIGTSPTISSGAIAIALNLDQVGDGITYIRMPAANMDANRRGLIDPSQTHVGGPLTDGSGLLLYDRQSPEYRGNFSSAGDLQSSKTMIAATPNVTSFFQDFVWEWTYTYDSANNQYLFNIWYDNGRTSGVTATTSGSFTVPAAGVTQNLTLSSVPSSVVIGSMLSIPNGANPYVGIVTGISGTTLSMMTWKTGSGGAGSIITSGSTATLVTDALIYLPSYISYVGDLDINMGHSTSASPSMANFVVPAGDSLYLLAYWNPSSGIHAQAQLYAFSAYQMRIAVQDGGYVAAFATTSTGGVYTPTGTSGGSGSKPGNGGRATQ